MSYPKEVQKFIAWTKAMVAGATVGQPNYGKSSKTPKAPSQLRRRRKRRRFRKKRMKGD